MTKMKSTVLTVMVLLLIAGLMTGCATKGTAGKGAYARAEKAGTPPPPPSEGPTDRPPLGEEVPFSKLPDAPAGICDRIHFDYDKSDIKPEWIDCLTKIAAYLVAHPEFLVVIEGHCDERGTNEYNMALGERRSKSAQNFLMEKGVAAERIVTRSMGEEKPLETCHDESCWKVNRRDEFFGVRQAR
ncbi:MAG: peptidoglycan-associated lipoprotein Pal [Candidatus Omnitrophota bacterium]